MTEKLKQIAKEEMTKLPEESREAINSLDWAGVSEEIGKKYLLDESETNDLQTEILLVLIGMEYFELFADNVEDNVGTTKEEAEKIAAEAADKIFQPIADKIEEKIKEGLRNKNPHWQQNIDFIISGGDYSSFLERTNMENNI